jgi:hypothetical protein
MPYRRATAVGDTPDWKLSAAIACFCSRDHRHHGSPRVINSIRELPPLVRLLVRVVSGVALVSMIQRQHICGRNRYVGPGQR